MKCMLYLLSVCVASQAALATAPTPDTTDSGVRDTLYWRVTNPPCTTKGDYKVIVTLACFNDSNKIRGISAGFKWDNRNLRLDSAAISATAATSFDYAYFFYRSTSLDSTNNYRQFAFFAVSTLHAGLKPSSQAKELASYFFSASKWTAYDSVVIDTNQFFPGLRYIVSCANGAKYSPVWGGKAVVYDAERPCCIGQRGNVDSDPAGEIDISDLQCMISYIKGETTTLPCPPAANVNGSPDGVIDLVDVLMLSDYLYGLRSTLPPCEGSE